VNGVDWTDTFIQ